MRATLVLLFAVGVSSMKMPEVQTSDMKATQNNQPLYIPMIDNIIDNMNDLKDMQLCQETTRSAMPEDDSAHMDGVGPRINCNVALTNKWEYCRKACASFSCRSINWSNYLDACFGGKDVMTCSHSTKPYSERCKEECNLDGKCKQVDEKCELKEQCKIQCRGLTDSSDPKLADCHLACDTKDLRRCKRRCNDIFVNSPAHNACIQGCAVITKCKDKCDADHIIPPSPATIAAPTTSGGIVVPGIAAPIFVTRAALATGLATALLKLSVCKASCDATYKSTCEYDKLEDKENCQEKCEGNC